MTFYSEYSTVETASIFHDKFGIIFQDEKDNNNKYKMITFYFLIGVKHWELEIRYLMDLNSSRLQR